MATGARGIQKKEGMKYLGLGATGMIVYSAWLLPNGQIIHIDLDRPDYFEHLAELREKYGEI